MINTLLAQKMAELGRTELSAIVTHQFNTRSQTRKKLLGDCLYSIMCCSGLHYLHLWVPRIVVYEHQKPITRDQWSFKNQLLQYAMHVEATLKVAMALGQAALQHIDTQHILYTKI